MHLQAAWAHFVDDAVLADPWLAGMLESSAMLASQSTQQEFSKKLATQCSGTARAVLRERNEASAQACPCVAGTAGD
jgi:hypothetical protein